VREQFLTKIRNDKPIWELAHYIEDLVQSEPVVSRSYQHLSFNLERLADEESTSQVLQPPANLYMQFTSVHTPIVMGSRPWTILADDEMVSHLLSLYFTWQQPLFQYIDRTAFLADMASQTTVAPKKFCSPLLVNAILAQACVCSSHRTMLVDFLRLY